MAAHDLQHPARPLTRLLFIGYVWPEPRSSAASGHVMQLLQCFIDQGWQITFASPASAGPHKADLRSLGIAECSIQLNDSSFDRFVCELDPHIVVFDQFMIEEQFGWRVEKHCPAAVRILETSDLQSLRHARHAILRDILKTDPQTTDLTDIFQADEDCLFAYMASTDLALREVAALYRCDLSLMTSDLEMRLLSEGFNFPPQLLHWCPLMLEGTPASQAGFAERAHFLSIGNFRHAPNWDAVLWMKNAVWPLIRRQLPEAQLHVYGAYTPPKATALHNAAQGFLVKDWAEDALQVMAAARVCLAPLRFGAGIKGKLIDAMLCGTPSVTTPIGSEAMHGSLPWPGLIAETAQGIADAAVQLYRDQACWEQAQLDGWQLLQARYRYQTHCASLIERIEALRHDLPRQRLNNFTGAMLRHHQHKSTQYMAQWIEAKNRAP